MKYTFSVPDMTCGHCKKRIEEKLSGHGEISFVSVDLEKKLVFIESDLTDVEVINLIDEAGYDAALV